MLRFVAQVTYARQRRCASLPRRMSSPASSCSSVECAPAAARTSLEVGATISVLIRSRSCFRPLLRLIICFGIVSRVVLGWNGSCVSRVRGSVRLFFFFCSGYALVIVYAVYSTRVLVPYMGNGQLFVFGSFFLGGPLQFQISSMQGFPMKVLRLAEAFVQPSRKKAPQMQPEGRQSWTAWYIFSGVEGHRLLVSTLNQ